jgi:hypothetical protein
MNRLESIFAEERPEWPNQIREISELEVGQIYWKVYSHLDCAVKFIFKGFTNDKTFRLIETPDEGPAFEDYTYFSDCGLAPYDNGKWNSSNYIATENPYRENPE